MLSLLATSLLLISADLASARGRWRAARGPTLRADVDLGEETGKIEGVENMTLQSFADFKADFDANLNGDPDFERWLFGGKQSTFTMSNWLRRQGTPWQPWQASNWSTVINQASLETTGQVDSPDRSLKELAAMYRSRKTSWMRERQASWQAHLKKRYIAAWYLERMLPRHEAVWEAARVCPCRSVLDRRCPLGSNCYGQRLAAGYYYDKDGNPNIRTCYTVPATLQSDISARDQNSLQEGGLAALAATYAPRQSGIRSGSYRTSPRNIAGYPCRYGQAGCPYPSAFSFGRAPAAASASAAAIALRHGLPRAEAEEELSCTDRMTHADFLKAKKILLANIRDDKGNPVPDVTAAAMASTASNTATATAVAVAAAAQPLAATAVAVATQPRAAAAATAATNWDYRW